MQRGHSGAAYLERLCHSPERLATIQEILTEHGVNYSVQSLNNAPPRNIVCRFARYGSSGEQLTQEKPYGP